MSNRNSDLLSLIELFSPKLISVLDQIHDESEIDTLGQVAFNIHNL